MTQDEAVSAAAGSVAKAVARARRGGNVDLDAVAVGVAEAQTIIAKFAPAVDLGNVDLASADAIGALTTEG